MTESERDARRIDVALVHGTWAQSAAWTQPDSMLATTLRGIPDAEVTISAPGWSGKNREKDRWKAMEVLRKELRESKAGLKVVVGHSHGGNIGALALHSESEGSDSLGQRALVTLNTPFLVPTRRSAQVTIFHICLLVIAFLIWVNSLIDQNFGDLVAAFSPILTVGIVLLGFFILMPLVGGLSVLLRMQPLKAPWLDHYFHRKGTDHETRVMCVATADDEALGWLQFTESLLNAPFLILHRLALPAVLLIMALAHYMFEWDFSRAAMADYVYMWNSIGADASVWEYLIGQVTRPPLPESVDAETVMRISSAIRETGDVAMVALLSAKSIVQLFVMFWAITAIAGLAGTYVLGAAAFGTGLGLRTLFSIFVVRMRVSPVPTGFCQVELVEIDPAQSGWLRHSNAYNDEKVAEHVRDWIEERATQG